MIIKNNVCKICFKNLNEKISFSSFLMAKKIICDDCLKKFVKINKKTRIKNVETTFLYEYDDFFRHLLYLYKGCYDIELKDVFLYEYKHMINKKYHGFTVIYPPSSDIDNKNRGFIHMEEIAKTLNLKEQNIFYKSKEYKQSSHVFALRRYIKDYIKLKPNMLYNTKKYLIIDDVYTSGSTINTIIDILLAHHIKPNNIACIILSKTKNPNLHQV